VPYDNSRLLEEGVERVLNECSDNCKCAIISKRFETQTKSLVPLIVVFTKVDQLRTQVIMDMFANCKKKEFYADVEKEVELRIEKLCVIPLREATSGHSYPHVAVSSAYYTLTASLFLTEIPDQNVYKHKIEELVDLAGNLAKEQWVNLAIAQHSKAEMNLRASTEYALLYLVPND
jgi:hypothetical protein